MELTHNGKTQTTREWSKDTGISESVILNRLAKNWTVERTLTEATSWRLKFSKTDFERKIDEMKLEELPPNIQKLVNSFPYEGTRYGTFLRRAYLKAFDKFYADTYKEKLKIK